MQKLFFLFIATLAFTACGSDEPTDASDSNEGEANSVNITINDADGNEASNVNIDLDEIDGSIEDAMKQVSESLNITLNDEDGEAVEVMNFRDIKATMPDRLLGMERTSHTGEKNGAFGISISQAQAKYRDDDRQLDIQILDGGGMAIAKLAGAAWTNVEVDRETDNGYERTTTIDGYKAFEKWEGDREKGEIQWLYKDRYIVSVEGRGIDADDLRRALKKLDVEDLE